MWTGHLLPILANYSQFISGFTIFTGVAAWWHHIVCVEKGCFRKGHKDPVHGHPVCRIHQSKV